MRLVLFLSSVVSAFLLFAPLHPSSAHRFPLYLLAVPRGPISIWLLPPAESFSLFSVVRLFAIYRPPMHVLRLFLFLYFVFISEIPVFLYFLFMHFFIRSPSPLVRPRAGFLYLPPRRSARNNLHSLRPAAESFSVFSVCFFFFLLVLSAISSVHLLGVALAHVLSVALECMHLLLCPTLS